MTLTAVVHTASFLRGTSLILFNAVLAASSKFFKEQMQAALLAQAKSLISRAIDRGVCETAIVQAILILVYWKEPSDKSAWIKIGVALRMAHQMRWHEPRKEALPMEEFAARRVLVSTAAAFPTK